MEQHKETSEKTSEAALSEAETELTDKRNASTIISEEAKVPEDNSEHGDATNFFSFDHQRIPVGTHYDFFYEVIQ